MPCHQHQSNVRYQWCLLDTLTTSQRLIQLEGFDDVEEIARRRCWWRCLATMMLSASLFIVSKPQSSPPTLRLAGNRSVSLYICMCWCVHVCASCFEYSCYSWLQFDWLNAEQSKWIALKHLSGTASSSPLCGPLRRENTIRAIRNNCSIRCPSPHLSALVLFRLPRVAPFSLILLQQQHLLSVNSIAIWWTDGQTFTHALQISKPVRIGKTDDE